MNQVISKIWKALSIPALAVAAVLILIPVANTRPTGDAENGKKVFEFTEARAADKDQDTTEVNLQKGVNVLVCKVVNEKMDWSLCVRFVDKDDNPVKKLKVQLTPK